MQLCKQAVQRWAHPTITTNTQWLKWHELPNRTVGHLRIAAGIYKYFNYGIKLRNFRYAHFLVALRDVACVPNDNLPHDTRQKRTKVFHRNCCICMQVAVEGCLYVWIFYRELFVCMDSAKTRLCKPELFPRAPQLKRMFTTQFRRGCRCNAATVFVAKAAAARHISRCG